MSPKSIPPHLYKQHPRVSLVSMRSTYYFTKQCHKDQSYNRKLFSDSLLKEETAGASNNNDSLKPKTLQFHSRPAGGVCFGCRLNQRVTAELIGDIAVYQKRWLFLFFFWGRGWGDVLFFSLPICQCWESINCRRAKRSGKNVTYWPQQLVKGLLMWRSIKKREKGDGSRREVRWLEMQLTNCWWSTQSLTHNFTSLGLEVKIKCTTKRRISWESHCKPQHTHLFTSHAHTSVYFILIYPLLLCWLPYWLWPWRRLFVKCWQTPDDFCLCFSSV